MSELAQKTCIPCRGGVPSLTADEIRPLQKEIPAWTVRDNRRLERDFPFVDFATALKFVNQIGAEAEAQGHHPDLKLVWGKVGVEMWTHKIDGLTESDFIFAAKIDRLWAKAEGKRG